MIKNYPKTFSDGHYTDDQAQTNETLKNNSQITYIIQSNWLGTLC